SGLSSVKDILKAGDVIMVEQVTEDGKKVYGLRQIPKVNGAIVALDPHTGRVLAMDGGWSYGESEFNRATQALRQPGSAFKPFVYLTALDKDFTPATLVLDAPLVIDQGPGLSKWRPSNYTKEFYGPTPLRVGIEKSRNLMTVRLAEYIGMKDIVETVRKFGVMDDLPPLLANCLGSGETTLLRLTTGYAQFVNGGKKITPSFIDRIQDRRGKTILQHDARICSGCGPLIEWKSQATPEIPDTREQIADPAKVYQIVSMLEGVVQRGTGVRIKSLKRPLAGKTGTTNESKDTWFIGFSPDLAVGVFIGFDEPKSMGKKETGSSVAVPVFRDFMAEALKDTPPIPFRIPPGIRQVQINAETGARAKPGDKEVIWEAFVAGTEATENSYILDANGISYIPSDSIGIINSGTGSNAGAAATTGTGGIY
ncbi:MAG: penicillin-binding protein, partial [Proteobacteria bacterium]|nr:penicillin-binding protein [Pseudomonadota bacterium]